MSPSSTVPRPCLSCHFRNNLSQFLTHSPQFIGCRSPNISLSCCQCLPLHIQAGLYNGTVILYNVRSTEHSPVLDSRYLPPHTNLSCVPQSPPRDAVHQHCGPVWQVVWVLREKNLGEDVWSEALVSTSTDGRVLQVRCLLQSSVYRAVSTLPPLLAVVYSQGAGEQSSDEVKESCPPKASSAQEADQGQAEASHAHSSRIRCHDIPACPWSGGGL